MRELGDGTEKVENIAKTLVLVATPVVGEIHPQRATFLIVESGSIIFITPGGVAVEISPWTDYRMADVLVFFHRNSHVLAGKLLGSCMFFSMNCGAGDIQEQVRAWALEGAGEPV